VHHNVVASQRSGCGNSLAGLANIVVLDHALPVELGANNDHAELHISSEESFVVSNSTAVPSLIDIRRKVFLSDEKTLPIRAFFARLGQLPDLSEACGFLHWPRRVRSK